MDHPPAWLWLFEPPYYVIVAAPVPRGGEPQAERSEGIVLPWRWLALAVVHGLVNRRLLWKPSWAVPAYIIDVYSFIPVTPRKSDGQEAREV
jgi:hypothetical protein